MALPAPVPSRAPPRSFTTTFAPREARSRAWARPRPPPAPVTMATRPSNLTSLMCDLQSSVGGFPLLISHFEAAVKLAARGPRRTWPARRITLRGDPMGDLLRAVPLGIAQGLTAFLP